MFCAFGLAALLAAGCSKAKNGSAKPPEGTTASKQVQALAVRTAEVQARTVQRTVEATGTLLPWDEVTVSSEVPGTVVKILADLGDKVSAGEKIAELDRREALLNLAEMEANVQTASKTVDKEKARLADAKTTLERYDELFKQGMVSESVHDNTKTQFDVEAAQLKEAQARLEQAQAMLNLSRKKLSDTVITSPITGEISKRYVSAGEAIREKTALFTVVSSKTLKFRGTVPEVAVPQLKAGQETLIAVEPFPGRQFKGKVTRISPQVARDTRTLEIEADVPNADGVLRPGFFAKGLVLTRKDASVSFAPETAVYSYVGITKVFVIKDGVAKERIVTTGDHAADMVEISGAVKPGETVAVSNLANIFDGARVTIEGAKPDAAMAQPVKAQDAKTDKSITR